MITVLRWWKPRHEWVIGSLMCLGRFGKMLGRGNMGKLKSPITRNPMSKRSYQIFAWKQASFRCRCDGYRSSGSRRVYSWYGNCCPWCSPVHLSSVLCRQQHATVAIAYVAVCRSCWLLTCQVLSVIRMGKYKDNLRICITAQVGRSETDDPKNGLKSSTAKTYSEKMEWLIELAKR